MLTFNKKK